MSDYPGSSIGLAQSGAGSLASWRARIGALIVDWAACLICAVALFGTRVLTGHGWPVFMPLAIFFLESSALTATLGGSFGQLLARIGVVNLSAGAIKPWQAIVRSALKCLVIPVVVIGAERRSILDIALGTVVVNRR